MAFLVKKLITPSQLGRAFALPFPLMVGSYTLLLALLYVGVGINPLPVIVAFLTDATVALSPLVATLTALWVVYTVIYIAVVGACREFISIQRNPIRASSLRPAWKVMFASFKPPKWCCFWQDDDLPVPLNTTDPILIGTRWHPGIHPLLN